MNCLSILTCLFFSKMCFNKELSLIFSLTSLGVAFWAMTGKGIWKDVEQWRLYRIEACFAYFCLMELLQFIQYLVIDDCNNMVNTIATALGYIHICWQPLFTNLIMSALDRKNLNRSREKQWSNIFKACAILGIFMAARIIIPAVVTPEILESHFHPCYREMDGLCAEKDSWKTCSTTGIYHIRWNFKMIRASYLFPNIGLHFIAMFVLPFAMGMRFESLLLFFSGPGLAIFFKVDDGERSSIWCFFSVMEELITFGSQILMINRSNKNKKLNKKDAEIENLKKAKESKENDWLINQRKKNGFFFIKSFNFLKFDFFFFSKSAFDKIKILSKIWMARSIC